MRSSLRRAIDKLSCQARETSALWLPPGLRIKAKLPEATDHSKAGLWGMESTSVIQQKGLPKDYFLHIQGGFPKVSQKWGETSCSHNPAPKRQQHTPTKQAASQPASKPANKQASKPATKQASKPATKQQQTQKHNTNKQQLNNQIQAHTHTATKQLGKCVFNSKSEQPRRHFLRKRNTRGGCVNRKAPDA